MLNCKYCEKFEKIKLSAVDLEKLIDWVFIFGRWFGKMSKIEETLEFSWGFWKINEQLIDFLQLIFEEGDEFGWERWAWKVQRNL